MRKLLNVTVALTLLLISSSAAAAVCVQVDEERDNLQPAERQATKTMVENSLRGQDLNVASENCTTTYTIYSLKLGNSVTANISGPEGSKTQKAHNIEELPETYDQMTAALISGEEGQTAGVNRHNVTKKQAAPRRVRADSIYYTRLGYGAVLGGDFASGPSVAFGWRYELDSVGIDISGLNFILDTSDGDGFTFTLVRLGGMYFFDPVSDSTPYVGGALSWGWTGVYEELDDGFTTYSGNGLQGELTAGYEFLRSSTLRVFVEANAIAPFYTASRNTFEANNDESVYTPSFSINIGLGYDPNPSAVVEVYD
jgi:hypothetical protein